MRYFNDKIHKTLKIKARSAEEKIAKQNFLQSYAVAHFFVHRLSEGLMITKGLVVAGSWTLYLW